MQERAQAARPAWATLVAETLREQGRTQRWLAGQLGMSSDTLYHLMSGDARYRQPSAALLERIALALGKHARWLFVESEVAPVRTVSREAESAPVAGGTNGRRGAAPRRVRRGSKPAGVLARTLGGGKG